MGVILCYLDNIISIHALLAESDFYHSLNLPSRPNFYPRSPCGERHDTSSLMKCQVKFLSTLSLRRATPVREIIQWEGIFLSTLSLRRATDATLHCLRVMHISIHALLAESDGGSGVGSWPRGIFLSTLSLRRATISIVLLLPQIRFLSTLSLRRATYLATR